jgi:hypothetical protein
MRNSLPTNTEIREGDQTVFFQIANGNARQVCSLKTKFDSTTGLPLSAPELEKDRADGAGLFGGEIP